MMDTAVIVCIDNNYVPILGCLLLSLKSNSPILYENSDFIVYHEDVSEQNQNYLKELCPNIIFRQFDHEHIFSREILDHQLQRGYSYHLYEKLYAFLLLKTYKYVIHLDVDMIVLDELATVFDFDFDISYCPNRSRGFTTVKKDLLKIEGDTPDLPICTGGIIFFKNSILDHILEDFSNLVNSAFQATKDIGIGSTEERIITYIAWEYSLKYYKLPQIYNSTMRDYSDIHSKILHLTSMGKNFKPWTNDIAYATFPDWGHYYRKLIRKFPSMNFLNLGGSGLINQHNLFSTLYSSDTFLSIINFLSSLDIPLLSKTYNFKNKFLQIYLDSLPPQIHYEVEDNIGTFTIGFHIENEDFFTPGVSDLFMDLKTTLDKKFNSVSMSFQKQYKINIISSRSNLENFLSLFIRSTILSIGSYYCLFN